MIVFLSVALIVVTYLAERQIRALNAQIAVLQDAIKAAKAQAERGQFRRQP